MSVHTGDDDTQHRTVGMEPAERQRYADLTFENGEVVIYDRENQSAWIQSPSAIGLDSMR